MRALPPGYDTRLTPYTGYIEYLNEKGERVYWYVKDTEGAREIVWHDYLEHTHARQPHDLENFEGVRKRT